MYTCTYKSIFLATKIYVHVNVQHDGNACEIRTKHKCRLCNALLPCGYADDSAKSRLAHGCFSAGLCENKCDDVLPQRIGNALPMADARMQRVALLIHPAVSQDDSCQDMKQEVAVMRDYRGPDTCSCPKISGRSGSLDVLIRF